MTLSKLSDSIGDDITKCRNKCEGTEKQPSKGIYPRCFYPEIQRRKSARLDYIVIGINPGEATALEKAFTKYIRHHNPRGRKWNLGFRDIRSVMKPIIESNDYNYYKPVRAFLKLYPDNKKKRKLNILWTELVKCQSKLKNKHLKNSTMEKCFHKFLKNEIEKFTEAKHRKPLLILLGREVQNFFEDHQEENSPKKKMRKLNYLALHHPRSWGKFHSYFLQNNIQNQLKPNIKKPSPVFLFFD